MRWTRPATKVPNADVRMMGPPVGGLASAFQCLQDDDDVVQRRLVELPGTPQGIQIRRSTCGRSGRQWRAPSTIDVTALITSSTSSSLSFGESGSEMVRSEIHSASGRSPRP